MKSLPKRRDGFHHSTDVPVMLYTSGGVRRRLEYPKVDRVEPNKAGDRDGVLLKVLVPA